VMYAGQLIERGPAERVTDEPAHPYTQLLCDAAPDPDRTLDAGPIGGGAGEPPSLISPPTGCRFHPRCPHVMDACRRDLPSPTPLTADHTARCWLYDGSLAGADRDMT
jgi:peptide/nickel transport system ATP-binding protein